MEEKWADMAVSFRYEKDQLIRWMRQTAGQKRRSTIYIMILALLALNFIIVIPTAQNKAAPGAMAGLCIALIVLVILSTKGKKGAKTVEALYQGGEEYRVFLRADEMEIRSAGQAQKLPYDGMKVQEHDDYYLMEPDKESLFILPKAALTDAQAEQLSSHCQKSAKSYKRNPR